MSPSGSIFYGAIINPKTLTRYDPLPNCLLSVGASGNIDWIEEDVEAHALQDTLAQKGCVDVDVVVLQAGEFLIPGFIDTHTTTTCCYYGTLHLEATKLLADIVHANGQRAFIGKCNMDRECPEYYVEPSVEASIRDTKDFITHVRSLSCPGDAHHTSHLVQPILTPRFAISCTPELLTSIGELASADPSLHIQTHISENPSEVDFVKELFPNSPNYAGVYDSFGLLRSNTILAHAVWLEDAEVKLIAERRAGISHCPTSNFNLSSGVARIGAYLDQGIKVGLGTDVSGGFSPSILNCVQNASIASKVIAIQARKLNPDPTKFENRQLPVATLLYLATMGGAEVCDIDKKVGSFEAGKSFDALLVNTRTSAGAPGLWFPEDDAAGTDKDALKGLLERFLFSGDDRNISRVYVQGRFIGGKALGFTNGLLLSPMSSIAHSIKHTVTTAMSTAKVADLDRDTIDTTASSHGMTTDFGAKVSDTDIWLKVSDGGTGPSLLEDHIGREKISRFDHERIPERVVHARGAAAHGYFKVFDDSASKYTFAPVLTDPSRTTPVFTRFSTVQGSKGSADTVRDVRGFAVKMYTDEGNWDIVGNDIPVFFIQEAIKFPDIIHAVKPEPHNEVPQGQSAHNNFWDFVGLQPESAHMIMWVMSDRGVPRSYRMIQGFGVNTYTLVNASGERHFVKFHFSPELGVHSLMWDEALKINGQDPDFHRKDLNEAILNGCPAKWTFSIQTIAEKNEHDFDFDILDATKIWPEELVPLQPIGEMVLNRTVDEYFPETEQVAFCTSHVVPGIGFSDDPLLQGRNFSYFDTQITRLGINFQQIPINRPVCPVMNHQRGGQHQDRIMKGEVNYWPNRKEIGPPVHPKEGGYAEYAQKVNGMKQRVRGAKFQEHYNQAEFFLNSLAPHEKAHLVSAISFELSHCDDPVVYKTYVNKILPNISLELARAVSEKVGGALPDHPPDIRSPHGKRSDRLSQLYYAPKTPTIASRRIAILVADGFNGTEVQAVRAALAGMGATNFLIGPRRGEVKAASGPSVVVDHHFEGQRSTLYDALFIPSGTDHAKALGMNGRTVHWVREAFGHCKAIGAIGEVLQHAVSLSNMKFADPSGGDDVVNSYGVVTTGKYGVASAVSDVAAIASGPKGFVSNFAHEISKHRCWDREMDGLVSQVAF
ncbi:catalase A [Tephrocybe rancida]|nr:catalase A [Tephrocybe rancida]